MKTHFRGALFAGPIFDGTLPTRFGQQYILGGILLDSVWGAANTTRRPHQSQDTNELFCLARTAPDQDQRQLRAGHEPS